MAIKIAMELDYPTVGEAFEKNPHLSTLISSSKCLEFSTKVEVENIHAFLKIKKDKYNEYLERFKDVEVTPEIEKALSNMAFQYAHDNFYYPSVTSAKNKNT